MRILVITGIFPPDVGGPATYVPRISAELMKRGHQVILLTLSDSLEYDDSVYAFDVVRVRREMFKPFRSLAVFWKIICLGKKVDILYVNGLLFEVGFANLFLRKPCVLKIVGDWVWERATLKGWTGKNIEAFQRNNCGQMSEVLKILRNACVRRTDAVIVPSHYLKKYVSSWGINQKKIQVIYNAVEISDVLEKHRLPLSTPFNIAIVGRLVPWKRVSGVVNILPDFKEVGLVIVGDGPEFGPLNDHVDRLDVRDRVAFMGRLNKGKVTSVLCACDLFVLNSTYEGLPHVVIEAMAVGLPVVATDVGGTGEVVTHGENGFLIPPSDKAALHRAVEYFLHRPERRAEIVSKGKKEVMERFSIKEMVEKTEAVLSEFIDK